jgi:N4-(beta-N-acetylglucosaminyl)-L-asparaginase
LLQGRRADLPLVVSTWNFGKPANEEAVRVLLSGGSPLDAVEKGIWVAESDSNNKSVGLSGRPNAAGVVQLDACIMEGRTHRAGSVAALEGIRHPISAARKVMEKTHHVMLVGEGARMFALQQGLESVPVDSRAKYETWQDEQLAKRTALESAQPGHDTIALLVLSPDGDIAGGCSTSGLGGKLPGRVGDSPILGSGLYVDNEVGAAGATGVGENVMRYCATFQIVELMRSGKHPTDACREVIKRILAKQRTGKNPSVNFIALDRKGRYGAAGTDSGFEYSVATRSESRLLVPLFVQTEA